MRRPALLIAAAVAGGLCVSNAAAAAVPPSPCTGGVRLSLTDQRRDVRAWTGGSKVHGYPDLDLRRAKLERTQQTLCVQLRVADRWRIPTTVDLVLNQVGPLGAAAGDLSEKHVYAHLRRSGVRFVMAERDDEPTPLGAYASVSGSWLTLALPAASVLPITTASTFTWNVTAQRYVRGRRLMDEVPSTAGDVFGFPDGKRVH